MRPEMPAYAIPSHPILSLDATRALEAALFGGDERIEWGAMNGAGRSVARAILGAEPPELGLFDPARLAPTAS